MGTLSDFLLGNKQQYLEDLKSDKTGKWTIVMGNEAGDLDSIASSLAYSYLASTLKDQPTVALIQTPRENLYLRPENLYAFQLASLNADQQDLLCIDDIPSASPPLPASSQFVLVDHNRIRSIFKGKVIGIIDHHEDEKQHLDAAFREIQPVGSCTSLVARHFQDSWTPSVPPEVATLLLSAIYIDTGGLKPHGKAVEVDHQSAEFLTPRSTFATGFISTAVASTPTPAITSLDEQLSSIKKDVGHLSTRDLLRRDYKEEVYGNLLVGLSSVPYGLKPWMEKDSGFWTGVVHYANERKLAVLGILTSFSSEKGKHKRELVVLLREGVPSEVEHRLFEGLESSDDLKLESKGGVEIAENLRARVWNQENHKASRKLIAPLVKSLIEGQPVEK